jgi:DNA-binding NtrC family response regulator
VSLVNQAKLLRLLNDGSYYKLGSDRLQRSQARIIAATNRDLVKDVKEGRFRQDLLARLRAHHLHLPPLRARSGDVARLVPIFVDRAAQELNKPAPHVSPALLQHLQAQAWPENVRGLWYACLDAVACHDGGALTRRHFRLAQDGPTAAEPAPAAANGRASWIPDVLPTLSEARDALIAEALRRTGGNQTVAASLLGMQRGTLNRWLVRRRGADANTDPSDFEENP